MRRFVFLCTLKVNGEFTGTGQPFATDHDFASENPYGVSKFEAELILSQIATETGMEVVIIWAPLVYESGVKANFKSMMRWLAYDISLPLAAVIKNCRCLFVLDNLVNLVVACLKHPAAANQTFLVSDDKDPSTVQLLKCMGVAIRQPTHLFYMPPSLLKFGVYRFE